ncbi:MAG: hypothetical protein M0Q21_00535 [Ignavibacteriaceae bacterium]|nr:hypothetical protein [Ignavibacteriaceae bacterium]
MKKHLLSIVLVITLLFSLSCKKSPTEVVDNTQPGRRDYVWKVDTLKVANSTYMSISRMWGGSPNDIWATGDAEESRLGLWHYDGNKWTCDNTPRQMMPRGIWGTSKDNIWIGNINSTFWHYDGVGWSEYGKYSLTGYSQLINQSMSGNSTNNIYATGFADNSDGSGYKAIIQHFDGLTWNFLNIQDIRSNFGQIKKNSLNQYFINSVNETNSQTPNKIFILEYNSLNQLYATDKSTELVQIGDQIYFLIGFKLYKYKNRELIFWKDFSDIYFLAVLIGRSEKDVFVLHTNEIKHFNGSDLINLFNIRTRIIASLIFEKEVFFLAKDFDTGICMSIKGELKE